MLVAMTLAGSIGFFVKTSGQSSLNVAFFRCFFGAIALAGVYTRVALPDKTLINRRQLTLASLSSLALVINWVLLFQAFRYIPIGMATIAYHTQPLILLLLGALVLRESLAAHHLFWILGAFAGLTLTLDLENLGSSQPNTSFGIILAIAAAILYAVTTLATRVIKTIPAPLLALIQTALGAGLLLPFLDFSALPSSAEQWASLIILGVVHTGLLYSLLYFAVQRTPMPLFAVLAYVYPIAALGFDWLIYGERLAPSQIGGIALVIFAGLGITFQWKPRSSLNRGPR